MERKLIRSRRAFVRTIWHTTETLRSRRSTLPRQDSLDLVVVAGLKQLRICENEGSSSDSAKCTWLLAAGPIKSSRLALSMFIW